MFMSAELTLVEALAVLATLSIESHTTAACHEYWMVFKRDYQFLLLYGLLSGVDFA